MLSVGMVTVSCIPVFLFLFARWRRSVYIPFENAITTPILASPNSNSMLFRFNNAEWAFIDRIHIEYVHLFSDVFDCGLELPDLCSS
jgi:hypothetical protein